MKRTFPSVDTVRVDHIYNCRAYKRFIISSSTVSYVISVKQLSYNSMWYNNIYSLW